MFHALSGSYAVNALDDIERAQFERHLSECEECQAEVNEFRETVALLSIETTSAPPAGLRERLLAATANVRPLPPQVERKQASPTLNGRGGHRAEARSRWTVLVAAAAAVVTLGAGGTVFWNEFTAEDTLVLSAADQVLQAADRQQAKVTLPDGAEVTLVRSERLKKAVLVTKDMPSAPAGKTYQMWLRTGQDSFQKAGLMKPDASQTILLEGDAANATAAAVSVEPAGGSEQPTSAPVVFLDFANLESA